jgi:two-component system sensor histidine kinase PilS (NtrC family)
VIRERLQFLKPTYDGPPLTLQISGGARLAVLLVIAVGAFARVGHPQLAAALAAVYAAGFASSAWYLFALRQRGTSSALLTWTQVLVDFGVVAATIGFTGGATSDFTFLVVIVILEAGVLMGQIQGFLFASLVTLFMLSQAALAVPRGVDPLLHWYNFLIQGIAFFFTAFVSGYWNQRVNRMKQFQRDILDNMSSGFLITDERGLVRAINKAGCQVLGLVEGNVAGRHVDGILRSAAGTECPVTTALRLEKDFSSYEFHVQTGPDTTKLLGLTTNRLRNSAGSVQGIIASFTDLTEMARMREEMQRHDRMAAVGELSAALAHEIRNPVAAIRTAMEELRGNADNPAMSARLAAIAVRESDHLNQIVSGFLDFARDPGRRHVLVDLRHLLDEILDKLRRRYQHAAELAIDLHAGGGPFVVVGDRTQLEQVFVNLAQNGVEAMRERGALRITLAGPPDTGERGPLEIRVEDEGPGIPPDQVARIFQPFYTDKPDGVGMGLAICHRLVTAHNGTIQVASRPGGGTKMIVRLPAAPREALEGAAL